MFGKIDILIIAYFMPEKIIVIAWSMWKYRNAILIRSNAKLAWIVNLIVIWDITTLLLEFFPNDMTSTHIKLTNQLQMDPNWKHSLGLR